MLAVARLLTGLRHLRRHLHYVAEVAQAGYAVENLIDVDILVAVVLASLPLIVGRSPPVLLLLALPLLLLPLALTLLHFFLLHLLLTGLPLLSA